jgi:hypothetical protein
LPSPFLNRNSRREFRLPHRSNLGELGGTAVRVDYLTRQQRRRPVVLNWREHGRRKQRSCWSSGRVRPRFISDSGVRRGAAVARRSAKRHSSCSTMSGVVEHRGTLTRVAVVRGTIGRWCSRGPVGKVDLVVRGGGDGYGTPSRCRRPAWTQRRPRGRLATSWSSSHVMIHGTRACGAASMSVSP